MPRNRAATCENKNKKTVGSLTEGSKLGIPLQIKSEPQSSEQNSSMIDSEEKKSSNSRQLDEDLVDLSGDNSDGSDPQEPHLNDPNFNT